MPLAKNAEGLWSFDPVAGAQEIRIRDVGRNELLTIDACLVIAEAQNTYFAGPGSGHMFAQRIVSTQGKQDGLYWPVADAASPSPLANLDALPKASLGKTPQEPLVLDGYVFRILTAQGAAASGGKRNYVSNGKMSGGFAILATPVKYAESGIMTFITGRDGVVYERNLGPDTWKIAASIREFNPTNDWTPVE